MRRFGFFVSRCVQFTMMLELKGGCGLYNKYEQMFLLFSADNPL